MISTKAVGRLCPMATILYGFTVLLPPNNTPATAISAGLLIVLRMTDNPRFPSPPILLTTIQSQIAALQAAHTKVTTGLRGTAAEREAPFKELRQSLRRLRDYVQTVAEATPAEAAAIATSAGMRLKKRSSVDKPILKAVWGGVAGRVLLKAKAGPSNVFYEWQMSTDQKTWTSLPSTSYCKTTVDGLTQGILYYFHYRATTDGSGDWSGGVPFLVK